MGLPGNKPSNRPTTNRVKSPHDWSEFPNVAYDGPVPELPLSRTIIREGEPVEIPLENRTRDWWNAVSRMPHCVAWQPSDWMFAIDTAMVHAMAVHGAITAVAELRQREKIMGTTMDARRDLRIRYVEPEVEVKLTAVPQLDDRRSRLTND